jgi:hypothetical protein
MKMKTRSPLKSKPLRNPGQSVQEQRDDLLYDKLLTPLMLALMLILLAFLEWVRYYRPAEPNPFLFTVIALVGVGYCVYQTSRVLPKSRQLRLAMEGEKAVGQYLERLREQGYQVFHDVIGEGFNLDHVVIGPAGIFTIETKSWSKPVKGSPRITFDGEHVLVNGNSPERDPVLQAKAQSGWLRGLLAESTGRKFSVKPVVVFPGWYIEQKPGATREIWVLEPKALPGFLSNAPTVLSPEDVKLASFHLSRFIRSHV